MRTFVMSALCLVCVAATVFPEDGEDTPGFRASYLPKTLEADQMTVGSSKTRKGSCSYGDTNAVASISLPGNKHMENDLLLGVRRVHLGLSSKIRSKDTLYGVLGINSHYTGTDRWDWQGNFVIQPDMVRSNIARKTRYIAALNGRFAASSRTGIHVGFYSELGMRASFVHPLIGVDYTRGPWLIQAIFPIKAGISYQGYEDHVLSLMARPFKTAVRVHKGLHDRPAIAQYVNTGGEFRWDYLPTKRWNFWAALGRTFGGTLFIGDKHNNHRHHIHLHQSPYFNIGVTFTP